MLSQWRNWMYLSKKGTFCKLIKSRGTTQHARFSRFGFHAVLLSHTNFQFENALMSLSSQICKIRSVYDSNLLVFSQYHDGFFFIYFWWKFDPLPDRKRWIAEDSWKWREWTMKRQDPFLIRDVGEDGDSDEIDHGWRRIKTAAPASRRALQTRDARWLYQRYNNSHHSTQLIIAQCCHPTEEKQAGKL